ncbi:hypothetical protein [Mycobacterium asiaticum]|uniref:Uncharacterized protein n=1 Tax=Mycobacterium asiaticum TaxID=1790 RepID=A0A1A3NL28_MYCAS|nr:hypothetical protein [Mycobacterium asiaticum]OBK22531.1 hypothetical protein A5635_21690 [Mycobacterium asiaticum]
MTERKGSLMRWTADCGHSMVVYSLEPTPTSCPDCHDKARKALDDWWSDISSAESSASECAIDDVAKWLEENDLELPDDIVNQLQDIANLCQSAQSELSYAESRLWRLLQDRLPKAERLTMQAVGA